MENKYLKSKRVEKLESGAELSLGMNRVKDEKAYCFSARLDGALPEGATVFLCHGYMLSYGRWIEISEHNLKICSNVSWAAVPLTERVYEHGLNIKNFISLSIVCRTSTGEKEIRLETDGGEYVMGAGHFSCCDGEITAKAEGVCLYDAFLGFTSFAYSHDIWIIGASYLSLGDPARWPYYWYADGGAGPFLAGRGGMGAQHGIADFKDALSYGAPKLLVWDSVSGNNPDKDDVLNPLFYDNTLEMLKICKEKGIKVYIQTMPSCPFQTNMYKNDVILNRTLEFKDYDYEVIDLARAVNARDEKNPAWFPGMLYTDNVHPTRLGGRASYLGIAVDAPELIVGKATEVYSSAGGSLKNLLSGEKLTVKAPEKYKSRTAITFRADFSGELSGKITIGSETGSSVIVDKDSVKVYSSVDDKAKLIFEAENPVISEKLINLKIDVRDGEASISLASMGEKNPDPAKTTLDIFRMPFTVDGDVFAEADGQQLTDARIKLVTVE